MTGRPSPSSTAPRTARRCHPSTCRTSGPTATAASRSMSDPPRPRGWSRTGSPPRGSARCRPCGSTDRRKRSTTGRSSCPTSNWSDSAGRPGGRSGRVQCRCRRCSLNARATGLRRSSARRGMRRLSVGCSGGSAALVPTSAAFKMKDEAGPGADGLSTAFAWFQRRTRDGRASRGEKPRSRAKRSETGGEGVCQSLIYARLVPSGIPPFTLLS